MSLPYPWMPAMSSCLTPGTAPASGSNPCQLCMAPPFQLETGSVCSSTCHISQLSGAVSPSPKARRLGPQFRACFFPFPCLRARSQMHSSHPVKVCSSSLPLWRARRRWPSIFPITSSPGSTLTFLGASGGHSPFHKH